MFLLLIAEFMPQGLSDDVSSFEVHNAYNWAVRRELWPFNSCKCNKDFQLTKS